MKRDIIMKRMRHVWWHHLKEISEKKEKFPYNDIVVFIQLPYEQRYCIAQSIITRPF